MRRARLFRAVLAPGPLVLLLCAVSIAIVAWALLVPPFAVPDEAEHFSYAQSLAENGERPPVGPVESPRYSTEARLAREISGTTDLLADLRYKPDWGAPASGSGSERAQAAG